MKPALLLLFAIVDVALTAILATEHDPLQYLSLHSNKSWVSQEFFLGASTFDLTILALIRAAMCIVYIAIVCITSRSSSSSSRAPLVEPLNASIEEPSDAAADEEEEEATRAKRSAARVLLVRFATLEFGENSWSRDYILFPMCWIQVLPSASLGRLVEGLVTPRPPQC